VSGITALNVDASVAVPFKPSMAIPAPSCRFGPSVSSSGIEKPPSGIVANVTGSGFHEKSASEPESAWLRFSASWTALGCALRVKALRLNQEYSMCPARVSVP
jgi:hypothetical protein